MSNVAVASCAPRENNSAGFGARSTYCAVMLPTRSPGRFWIRPTLPLFGVKDGLRAVPIADVPSGRKSAGKSGVDAVQIDVLDAAGDLRLGRIAEFEFVEDVARDPRIVVGTEQPVEQRAGIVGARRGQFLMPGLKAERRRHRRRSAR